jgi:hypothetical protein
MERIKMKSTITKTLVWLTIFSVAMGYLETSVVVYLRSMLYKGSFPFPLQPVEPGLAVVEFWREVATILMLAGAGIIAGRNKLERFSFFIYCFAVWDIFYYVFLKVLIDWPNSLLDWDILFLVPVPWVGPVLAPCIVSLTMIVFALAVVRMQENGYEVKVKWQEWLMMITGCIVILFSFMWDYITFVSSQGEGLWTLSSKQELFREAQNYVPDHYDWWSFAVGEMMVCAGIAWMVKRITSSSQVRTVKI